MTGDFTLRPGQTSHQYFDKYLFESDPGLLREVAAQAKTLVPAGTEVLAGLELGGVPVATALSLATGIPTVFVRKTAKSYGTAKLAEGVNVADKHVLIIEDVITTGGQVATSTHDLRSLGAEVNDVVCIIDRSDGNHDSLSDAGLAIRSLFTSADLVNAKPHRH